MNKKGFTLIELLATLVVLGIVMGIVLVTVTGVLKNAKEDSEDVFVETIKDAMEIYLDSDARDLSYTYKCEIDKSGRKVKLYEATKDKSGNLLTFNNVINSKYSPLTKNDLVNPSNKDIECNTSAKVIIYRDDDYVYYYDVLKSGFNCLLNKDGYISNLLSRCQ